MSFKFGGFVLGRLATLLLVLSRIHALVGSLLITVAQVSFFRSRVGILTETLGSLLDNVSLDRPADLGQLHWGVVVKVIRPRNVGILRDEVLGVFRNANLARNTVALHLVGDQHTVPENVVPHHLASNDAGNDSARVNSDPHVEVLQIHALRLVADLGDDVDHLEAGLDHAVGFVQNDVHVGLPPALFNSAVVPHDDVAVPDGVHFVDLVLLAELVESREHLRKQVDDVSRILGVLAEGRELDHVGEEEGAVLELVDLALFVFDDVDHVLRYQFADELVGDVDLHVEDALVVQTLPLNHFSVVNAHS